MAQKPKAKSMKKATQAVARTTKLVAKPKPVAVIAKTVDVAVLPVAAEAPPVVVKPLRMPVNVDEPLASRVWKGLFRARTTQDAGMREHMAAVKAGVLQQLETLSAEKGMPVKTSPFRDIVLPQMKRRRAPWVLPLAAGSALLLVVVMVMVARKPVDPALVLDRTIAAIANHDIATLEKNVDVAAVASSIVNQVFASPQVNVQALPPELQRQLQDGVGARMTAFIKPGLAETLKDDFLAAVKKGVVSETDDRRLLRKLWHDLGGPNLQVGSARVAMEDDQMVVAELPLHRMDLGMTLPLQIVMDKGADGGGAWKVADIPNFSAVLDSLVEADRAFVEKQNAETVTDMEARVTVDKVRKAKAGSDALMVMMNVTNKGETLLDGLRLEVVFGDAAGQPLKTAVVTMDGELAPGENREQVWTVPVDARRAAERYVVDLPLSALTVKVVPVGTAADKRVNVR